MDYMKEPIFLSRIKNPEVKLISVLHNDPFGYYDHLFADLMTLRDSSIKEKIKRVARFFLVWKSKGNYTSFVG